MIEEPLQIGRLRTAFLSGKLSASELIERVLTRISNWDDSALWIARTSDAALRQRAFELDAAAAADAGLTQRLPLFGIPFAVKDNIDVAWMPTTAACPAFAYTPSETAPVVQQLLSAGAVLVGKTNLDQFAAGLVGTRSPYGVPRNPFDARYIPGGSSSGSAVAVAAGLVSFAFGTDTAGSGRVPAAFNNIVGLKPTRGLLSTRGVVPACRSLDCVSVFALTAHDASVVLGIAACFDPDDPLARPARSFEPASFGSEFQFGVPPSSELEFFGDGEAASLFTSAVAKLKGICGTGTETAFGPFRDAGRLLYDGPWLAERLHATQTLLDHNPDALLPVTRSIIEQGRHYTALDAYRAQYELGRLKCKARLVFSSIDVMLLPTTGTIYETAAINADPIRLNSNLGFYTSFVNLLDLTAIAVPAGFRGNGLPFGISLIAPAFAEHALLDLASRFQNSSGLPLGRPS
ncbi:MAG: allophanate hydrolase [Acetobacteraceae bacterium]|nr:allophanate hydrolase [Acetobacteraceae bacterium]